MRRHWIATIAGLAALALASPALAQDAMDAEPGAETSAQPAADEREAQPAPREEEKPEKPAENITIYIPPSRGSVEARAGAGTRAPGRLPNVEALAPGHVGHTTQAGPTLAWFVSGAAEAPVELTVTEVGRPEPLLERTVARRIEPGFHSASLDELGVRLEPGREYEWAIALVEDPARRDLDVVSSGSIRRVPLTPELEQALRAGPEAHRALARQGVWYDALAALSAQVAARPDDAGLRLQRAALLEQVGLAAAAAGDRAAAAR